MTNNSHIYFKNLENIDLKLTEKSKESIERFNDSFTKTFFSGSLKKTINSARLPRLKT